MTNVKTGLKNFVLMLPHAFVPCLSPFSSSDPSVQSNSKRKQTPVISRRWSSCLIISCVSFGIHLIMKQINFVVFGEMGNTVLVKKLEF